MRAKPGPPMTLANMRANGFRAITAACEACGQKADVNVDALPESVHVPHAGKRLRCSACGGKRLDPPRMAHGPMSGRAGFHDDARP
jgi:DNA-directed RNA polymerase subunit RPC12/RpoP